MAKILLSANPAQSRGNGLFSVIYSLRGDPDPLPSKLVDVKTTAEALAALETYKAEALATGKPIAVTMKVKEGRAPNGYKAATAGRFYHGVNV